MKQADKRALEAYPIDSYEGHDDMYRQRGAFAKGYEQAEKDLMDKARQWFTDNIPSQKLQLWWCDFELFIAEN